MIEVKKAMKIVIDGEDVELIERVLKSGITANIETLSIDHVMKKPKSEPRQAKFTVDMYGDDFSKFTDLIARLGQKLID